MKSYDFDQQRDDHHHDDDDYHLDHLRCPHYVVLLSLYHRLMHSIDACLLHLMYRSVPDLVIAVEKHELAVV